MPNQHVPKPKPEPIDNTELVRAFRANGGNVLHIRPITTRSRGVTFAYVERNGRVEFSTAVQHRNDDFTKKMGTKTAIEHFLEGKTVTMPLGTGVKALHALNNLSYFFN